MQKTRRAAVRVVCLDVGDRVLLLRWRDPRTGTRLWEPPGGGIEAGETPWQAARRELGEETGLDGAAIGERWVPVARDLLWNGEHHVATEPFFLIRFAATEPELNRDGLMPDEQINLDDHGWFSLAGLENLERLEPPNLAEIVRELVHHT